ncbi:trypsin-like peptidase domain-containing protein [Streptomyces coeruleorubidus]|uniref:Trypsin-like peptidase domain-containing protein n=1 Tax=Streptomyces coeruleorubidus TaxID=116188 RepID=A0ABZ0KRL6_STRC4|nr:trypsin-like peptidase domain-containing protein [Streptomyces coeruleorubidus]WOT40707.1 trypsin-like peptidase domain-containing protein [Streptomyces coeruleorubidus]
MSTTAHSSPRPGSDRWVAAIHAAEKDRTPLGSGFLVDARRVLTCAHVVFKGGQQRPELWVAFPNAPGLLRRRVKVLEVAAPAVEEQDIDDAAALILAEVVPEEYAAPLRQPEAAGLVGRRWWAFGFPHPDQKLGMLGNTADGVVGEAIGYGWVRLDTGSRYVVQPGYSGAALWSPDYEAVVGMVGQAQGNGDARAITVQAITGCLPGQRLDLLTSWSAEAAGESALAAWGWNLADDPEAGRHWQPRARGVHTDAQRGFRFRGRTAALTEVCDWLTDTQSRRQVLVVTGSPGVGKSAVLGRIVTTAAPGIAAALPSDDVAVRAPEGSVACAVHAKGKTALDVAGEIARAASARLPAHVNDLAPSVRDALEGGKRTGFTVVIDALDEAASPQQARLIIHHIARPLAETLHHLGVRVIVGTRRRDHGGPILEAFGNHRLVDLDTPKYFALADLAAYAMAALQLDGDERHDNPYNTREIAEPVAERIALVAKGNFLVAGLIAHAHGIHDQLPVPADALTFDPTVDAALNDYLALLPGVDGVSATALLTALAYAEAPGMPIEIWRAAISALGHTVPTDQQLRAFARSSAANFLIESSTDQPHVPVFQLFHQALNDALLRHCDITADERAITSVFLRLGQASDWAHAPAYLLRSLPGHATRGHAIEQLLRDDAYPLYADLRRLIPAAITASTPATRARARLLRKTPRAIEATPGERAALFSISEALHNLGSTYRTRSSAGAYRAKWAATLQNEEVVLDGHSSQVDVLCAVPAGADRFLLAAAAGSRVRLWDPTIGAVEQIFHGHGQPVGALCTVPAGEGRFLLVTGSYDSTVRLWDPTTGTEVHRLDGHTNWVTALCAVPAGDGRTLLATASHDHSVRLWDPTTGTEVHRLDGHTDPVTELCTVSTGDGRVLLASGSLDHTARLWDPAAGTEAHRLDGHSHWVTELCAVPVGGGRTLLATASNDQLRLWDPTTGAQDHSLGGRVRWVTALCAVPAGNGRTLLAIASGDNSPVLLWDPVTRTEERYLPDRSRTYQLCAVPAGGGRTLLATGSYRTVRLWDPTTGTEEQAFYGHSSVISAITTVPAGGGRTLLATGGYDRTVRLWDPTANTEDRLLDDGSVPFLASCTVSTGKNRILLVTAANTKVRLWHPATGAPGHILDHEDLITTVHVFSLSSGRLLLATGGDGAVRLWNPATGTKERHLRGHSDRVSALCTVPVSGGRTLLASASYDCTVRLWDPTTGAEERVLNHREYPVMKMCAVPAGDGRAFVATGLNYVGTTVLWDPATGTEEHRLRGHGDRVDALCTVRVPDGRTLLAIAGNDCTVRLWDPATGTEERRFLGHTDGIRALCTVPALDGRTLLATASEDRTVRLWDPATGTEERRFLGHTDGIRALCTVPALDGRTLLATASEDQTVRLYCLDGSPLSEIPIPGRPNALIAINTLMAITLDNGVLVISMERV